MLSGASVNSCVGEFVRSSERELHELNEKHVRTICNLTSYCCPGTSKEAAVVCAHEASERGPESATRQATTSTRTGGGREEEPA